MRRLSCDHEDGVAAARSREDAIDATAFSRTRDANELAQNRRRDHPRHRKTETSNVEYPRCVADLGRIVGFIKRRLGDFPPEN